MKNEEPFAPMPTPPLELARALGWRTPPTSEEVEEAASMDLFARATAVSNPWTVKPGVNGVIAYGDDDAREEREYASAIEPIAKLFRPKPPTATAPNLNLLPLPVEQDDDEKIYFKALAPIEKLFHPDAFTTVTPTATDWFLLPHMYKVPFSSGIMAGRKDGSTFAMDEYGRDRAHPDYRDQDQHRREWITFQQVKREWAKKRRGRSVAHVEMAMGRKDEVSDKIMQEELERMK